MAKTIAGKIIRGIKTVAQIINSTESILPEPKETKTVKTIKKRKK